MNVQLTLKVTAVDGVAQTIESISDLYTALGGASVVNFLLTYDSQAQAWLSYFGPLDRETAADRTLTDDMGILANLNTPTTIDLTGTPLEPNGRSTINLVPGLNVVGLPLRDERINRVSDLLRLDGIWGNVHVIILTEGGDFQNVARAGDPGDIPVTGGQGFVLAAQREAPVTISGDASASPPVSNTQGYRRGATTPVLALRGAVVDERIGLNYYPPSQRQEPVNRQSRCHADRTRRERVSAHRR